MIELVAEFLIPLIFAVIARYLIPYLKQRHMYEIAVIAVQAAEQLWKSGQIQKNMRFAEAELYIKNKLNISDEDARMLIEAVVAQLNEVA